MRRIGIAVGLVGVVAASYCLLPRRQTMPPDPPELSGRPAEPTRSPTLWVSRFKLVTQGHGRNAATGGSFSSSSFKAEDGTELTVTSERFRSSVAAREALEVVIQKAETVLEQGTMCDGEGRIVGERAIVVLPSTVRDRNRSVLVYRNGEELISFKSASATDVLEFDAAPPHPSVRPCNPPARP